jgi:hypothetical protein
MPVYKPHMKFGEQLTSCLITPVDDKIKIMEFGIDYDVYVEFQFEELFLDKIKSGMNIGLYEGKRLIGHGYLL